MNEQFFTFALTAIKEDVLQETGKILLTTPKHKLLTCSILQGNTFLQKHNLHSIKKTGLRKDNQCNVKQYDYFIYNINDEMYTCF